MISAEALRIAQREYERLSSTRGQNLQVGSYDYKGDGVLYAIFMGLAPAEAWLNALADKLHGNYGTTRNTDPLKDDNTNNDTWIAVFAGNDLAAARNDPDVF